MSLSLALIFFNSVLKNCFLNIVLQNKAVIVLKITWAFVYLYQHNYLTKLVTFFRYENDELHCFELNTSGKSRGGHVYGSRSISERRIWMQRIAESLTYRFTAKITSDYTRIGWAYIREGYYH